MKKVLAGILAVIMLVSLAACTSSQNGNSTQGSAATGSTSGDTMGDTGAIRYLNFKPEVAEVYAEIAAAYKAETGVTVDVITAASGTYEQTLKAEIVKSDAPTIFQINGPRGYANWKDYCADLSDSELYNALTDKNLALTSGDGVYGIPYVVEGYGIIVNNEIMQRYFALKNRSTNISDISQINNFETLSAVVEDMTKNKDTLGIRGVFASTSLSPGEDWRWHTHLANVPLHYEFKGNGSDLSSEDVKNIGFTYGDNMRRIFDLYINNSVTEPTLLGSKQVADSMAEFALGQCAMVQNGNWAWGQISQIEGNTVNSEDVKFIPIYTGIKGEENQGICIGTENYLAINSQSTPNQQKLALDFLYWLYSSDTGKNFVTNRLGFIAPFSTFSNTDRPADPLAQEIGRWMDRDDVETISWDFTVFPSQMFKDDFGSALLRYAQGGIEWSDVTNTVTTRWHEEYAQ